MAIMNARQFQNYGGFDAFAGNEAYCDKTYPLNTSTQMDAWNGKCKKSCSGIKCVTNPGLAAAPWTTLGKNARGLPDDSILGAAMKASKKLIPTKTVQAPGAASSPLTSISNFFTSPVGIAAGGIAVVGLLFALKKAGKGRR
jgi:hypothetical protein